MVAIAVSASLLGCPTAEQGEVQILNDAQQLLDVKLVAADLATGIAWGQSELQPAVPANPLDNGRVRYRTQGDATELDVFAVDPAERKQALQDFAWNEEVASHPYLWAERGSTDATPLALPRALAVPYPTEDVLFGYPDVFVERALNKLEFFQGASPVGPAAYPSGEGSVKAMRIYDHGACSFERSLSDIFAEADRLVGAQLGSYGCIENEWTHLVGYLDHEPGSPFDLRGGFFYAAKFHAALPDPLPDVDLWANYNYEFRLTDDTATLADGTPIGRGILTVQPRQNYLRVDAFDFFGTNVSELAHELAESALDGTVPDSVAATAYDLQTQPLVGSLTCDPTAPNPCAHAGLLLGAAIANGGATLGLLPPEISQLQDVASSSTGSNWRCVSPPREGPQCRYVVRAKRLNVYSDAVELVWFDGKELDNPAYAVWVAAHAPEAGAGAPAELCSYEPATQTHFRRFASLSLGSRGGGGSCCTYGRSASRRGGGAAAALLLGLAFLRRRRGRRLAIGALVAAVAGSGCTSVVETPGTGGAGPGGSGGSTTSSTETGGGGAAGWTDCASPSGYAICGGDLACPDCPDGCLKLGDEPISTCMNDAFLAFGYDICWLCADGDACVSDTNTTFMCAPFELAQLYAKGGHPERATYADHGAFTGDPLPDPETCSSFATFQICGGHCGGCPIGEVCTGRSPRHPWGHCVSNDVLACSPSTPCQAGYGCFSYVVEPEMQAVADYYNFCFEEARCLDMAANYPGGGKCVL